jgi:hypothetical protein
MTRISKYGWLLSASTLALPLHAQTYDLRAHYVAGQVLLFQHSISSETPLSLILAGMIDAVAKTDRGGKRSAAEMGRARSEALLTKGALTASSQTAVRCRFPASTDSSALRLRAYLVSDECRLQGPGDARPSRSGAAPSGPRLFVASVTGAGPPECGVCPAFSDGANRLIGAAFISRVFEEGAPAAARVGDEWDCPGGLAVSIVGEPHIGAGALRLRFEEVLQRGDRHLARISLRPEPPAAGQPPQPATCSWNYFVDLDRHLPRYLDLLVTQRGSGAAASPNRSAPAASEARMRIKMMWQEVAE